ncbi:trypsin, alkaline B isoform X1 [Plutella xylostella]|uniref:trypsin, alkaline B-like isoform X2 n=1 Tax=Plutella xylostella TaxID=51655 RepID=UPI0020324EDC|nr:trypsin, alkaline B-like isoform X2 [Plutella xylostella]XP_048486989.1 trypsin, alkaline B isoform X1 [Plutella xylostella]
MVFRMKLLIMTVLFYYGCCEDTVTVREPPARPAPPANRIVRGHPTTVKTYPYMAYLTLFFTMRGQKLLPEACGGVILTQHHVLTAAHCLHRKINDTTAVTGNTILRASEVVIRVGSSYNDRGGSEHVTSKTVVHEDYKFLISYDNDVAVLVLPTSMSNYRSSSVQPAAIPPGGYVVPDNASVVAVGWGLTDENCNNSSPLGLRHVGLRTVDRDTCAARYSIFSYNNMLCAGLLGVGGAGICSGDSGGPLVYNGVVVGVTSFSVTCDDSFYPQVFMRVSSYTNWINNTVSQNQVVVVDKNSHNTAVAADVTRLMLLVFATSIGIMYSKISLFF